MSIKVGDNNSILALNFGGNRIAQVYFGPDLVFQNYFVKLTFYFDRTNVNPRDKLGSRAKKVGAEWRSTSDPHVWYVITPLYTKGAGEQDPSLGIGKLFVGDNSDNGLLQQNTLGTCQVTSIEGDIDKIQTIDRLFQKCNAITSISKTGFYDKFANSTALFNVNSLCKECTGITDGSSLDGYNVLKNVSTITTHAATFANADSTANLDQIPTGWGGNMAPPAAQLDCTKTNNAGWIVSIQDPDWPDFSTVTTLQVFTTSSISQYDGVNMRKSNIWNKNSYFSSSLATYYYPCFMQGTGNWPTGGGKSFTPTWVFGPTNYNGMLDANTAAGDMPGTLDYESYGPFSCLYGTYDSSKTTYFGFIVLNDPANITSFDPATTGFGIHSNSNFRDMVLNWFIPS